LLASQCCRESRSSRKFQCIKVVFCVLLMYKTSLQQLMDSAAAHISILCRMRVGCFKASLESARGLWALDGGVSAC